MAALCPADPGSSLPRSVGGHRRSGPVGLDVRLGGQDWDTQEAWTVHTRPRVDQTGPTRRAGELKPAQPVARWRRRGRHSLEVCSCKLMAPRFSILSLLDQVSPYQAACRRWRERRKVSSAVFVLSVLGGRHRCRTVPGLRHLQFKTNKSNEMSQVTGILFWSPFAKQKVSYPVIFLRPL